MKEYRVSFYLGDLLHIYILDADNEHEASQKALNCIPKTSRPLFHKLKVERFYREW